MKNTIKNVKWLAKYNTLKVKARVERKNLLNQIDDLVQQLAEVRADLEYTKTREKLARKQIKELKIIIKDQKEEEKNVRSN